METIKYVSGNLEVLDESLFPHRAQYVKIEGVEDGYKVIDGVQIRGSVETSIVACLSLAVEIYGESHDSKMNLQADIEGKLNYLLSARFTNMKRALSLNTLIVLAYKLSHDSKITCNDMKKR